MNQVWTEKEREYVKLNAGYMTDQQMAAALSRITQRKVTLQAVRKQRQKLGIKKRHGRGVCEIAKNSDCGDAAMTIHIAGSDD